MYSCLPGRQYCANCCAKSPRADPPQNSCKELTFIFPIFYDPRQSLQGVASYSPSADKPERFIQHLRQYLGEEPDIRSFEPVTREDLCLVHDKAYVDDVFNGVANNGFENNDPRVAEACLWTVGSMVAAALYAPYSPDPVCSPTSGFHHAGYNWGGGYCTFNGLAVAAAKFIQAHPNAKVGILDLDWHYGDGTESILRNKPELAGRIIHQTSGAKFIDRGDQDEVLEFWAWLHGAIEEINNFGCQVVLYQAGADMHRSDPLGGLLSDIEMLVRDQRVFAGVRAPIAWNLAGGYRKNLSDGSSPVLHTHRNTYLQSNWGSGIRKHLASTNQRKRSKARNLAATPAQREAFHAAARANGIGENLLTTPPRGTAYPSSHLQQQWEEWLESQVHPRALVAECQKPDA